MQNKDYIEQKYMPNSVYDEEIIRGHKQKDKCIFKIEVGNNSHGTGFLCKLPFGNKKNLLPVLITNNHVINKDYISETRIIMLTKDNGKEYFLYFNNENCRRFYTEEENDITIIEILHDDNIDFDSFLEVDDNCLLENPNNIYKNNNAYVIHFPKDNNATLTTGKIEKIEENIIYHKCTTEEGSSGCPIINSYNNQVVGIHKGYNNRKELNCGIFIKYAIIKFHQEMVRQGKNY